MLFDGEKDGEGVEGVDAGVGERRFGLQQLVRNLFFLADQRGQLLLDLLPRHGPYHNAVFRRPRRWWPLYIGWIALCAILFLALGDLEDPSRPKGRILSIEAGQRALAVAGSRGLRGFEVVHVARARAGEGAPEDRWVVLLDRVPHTRLREAVVVELHRETGDLLRVRRPKR